MKTCAIFDLDGTIIDRSSELWFFFYLLKRGKLPIGSVASWGLDWISLLDIQKGKANKTYLRGASANDLSNDAGKFFSQHLVNRISPRADELIKQHKSEGRLVVILSGSLTMLVRQFAQHFELDTLFGNDLEVVNGLLTGALAGVHPYGREKANLVETLSIQHQLDLSNSYAYGNHHTDAYKLSLFGHPTAVNPTQKLRQIAQQRGWTIEMFHGN